MAARLDRRPGPGPGTAPPAKAGPKGGTGAAGDTAICPLCQGPNHCVLADGGAAGRPCWCEGLSFDAGIFARLSAHDLGRRCVCAHCASGAGPVAGQGVAGGPGQAGGPGRAGR